MTDPTELRELGRRFWYRWAAGAAIAGVTVVAAVWSIRPTNAWLVAVCGLLAVVHLAFATMDLALENRSSAAGNGITASGWSLLGAAATVGFPDHLFWGGFAIVFFGSTVALYADHGRRLRAAIAR